MNARSPANAATAPRPAAPANGAAPDPAARLSAELEELARGADAPAVPLVDRLLAEATTTGASDLHVEPDAEDYAIRLRLDGVLQRAARLPRRAAPHLVARLKVLAELPTYVADRPQDGRIPAERAGVGRGAPADAADLCGSRGGFAPPRSPPSALLGALGFVGPRSADLRLSVLPTIHGEKAVVRFFDPGSPLPRVEDLDLPSEAAAALEQAVLAPDGLVVLSGPAGSGKSTTIHAALQRVQERSGGARSVVGIEDPVERVVPGVTQAQVDPVAGFGFAQAVRAFLRQDPEVLYVGEIRDPETAGVAVEAGLTGHLVITTLHAGSAVGVLTRLLEMGVAPHLLTSALRAAFAQRLLRRLCSACAVPSSELPAPWPDRLDPGAAPRRPLGCPECRGTGYRGRLPLVEHLLPTPALRRALLERADEADLTAALGPDAGPTLLDRALDLVAAGTTAPVEVERVLGAMT